MVSRKSPPVVGVARLCIFFDVIGVCCEARLVYLLHVRSVFRLTEEMKSSTRYRKRANSFASVICTIESAINLQKTKRCVSSRVLSGGRQPNDRGRIGYTRTAFRSKKLAAYLSHKH